MNPSVWFAIYLPLFILFFVIFPRQKKVRRIVAQKIRKRKGLKVLTNEMIKKYKGKRCKITTGALGTTVVGKMVEINENWIEIETRKGIEIINSDFIQSVRII
ncbi:MAG TPA: hypothetical protein VJ990_04285 [Clostridia bacterium]|nr:hypothetical protein [Clostridia bacterium]